jgi:Tfp pilus assembly protein PilV
MFFQRNSGQILIETIVASLLMVVIMVAFAKLIEKKRTNKMDYKNIQVRLEELNAATNDPAK